MKGKDFVIKGIWKAFLVIEPEVSETSNSK